VRKHFYSTHSPSKSSANNLGNKGRSFSGRPHPQIQEIQTQGFTDKNEALQEAQTFIKISKEEVELNKQASQLLEAFQNDPTKEHYESLIHKIEKIRILIKQGHEILAVIIKKYEASRPQERAAFFHSYLKGRPKKYGSGEFSEGEGDLEHEQIKSLFDELRKRTVLHPDIDPEKSDKDSSSGKSKNFFSDALNYPVSEPKIVSSKDLSTRSNNQLTISNRTSEENLSEININQHIEHHNTNNELIENNYINSQIDTHNEIDFQIDSNNNTNSQIDSNKLIETIEDSAPQNTGMERSLFLTFMLQGLRDDMGVDQYRKLNHHLGKNRKIVINRGVTNDMQGGINEKDNIEWSRKTDTGDKENDQKIFKETGSGLKFLKKKFEAAYPRESNPEKDRIGNAEVNMDVNNELFPIMMGVDKEDKAKLFAAPKKMALHHEIGHLISMLQGLAGGGKAKGKFTIQELGSLTDQEEMYNIWGGPRSDRAYGQSLGFPRRFNHGSIVAYDGNIKKANYYNSISGALASGFAFTHTLPELQELVIREIRRLLDSSWGGVTQWRFTPEGVKEMREYLKRKDFSLHGLIQTASRHYKQAEINRHEFVKEFYWIIKDLHISHSELGETLVKLKKMRVPKEWNDGKYNLGD
jgi:hypothetical protein